MVTEGIWLEKSEDDEGRIRFEDDDTHGSTIGVYTSIHAEKIHFRAYEMEFKLQAGKENQSGEFPPMNLFTDERQRFEYFAGQFSHTRFYRTVSYLKKISDEHF